MNYDYLKLELSGMPKTTDKMEDFEKSLIRLEKIVNQMESGELSLEESLDQFEKGIKLAKNCQDTLSNAKIKVEKLIEKNGLQQTLSFDKNDEN